MSQFAWRTGGAIYSKTLYIYYQCGVGLCASKSTMNVVWVMLVVRVSVRFMHRFKNKNLIDNNMMVGER